MVSTHSHPKVAAKLAQRFDMGSSVKTHSHPKVAAAVKLVDRMFQRLFQHTATRRWLPYFG